MKEFRFVRDNPSSWFVSNKIILLVVDIRILNSFLPSFPLTLLSLCLSFVSRPILFTLFLPHNGIRRCSRPRGEMSFGPTGSLNVVGLSFVPVGPFRFNRDTTCTESWSPTYRRNQNIWEFKYEQSPEGMESDDQIYFRFINPPLPPCLSRLSLFTYLRIWSYVGVSWNFSCWDLCSLDISSRSFILPIFRFIRTITKETCNWI